MGLGGRSPSAARCPSVLWSRSRFRGPASAVASAVERLCSSGLGSTVANRLNRHTAPVASTPLMIEGREWLSGRPAASFDHGPGGRSPSAARVSLVLWSMVATSSFGVHRALTAERLSGSGGGLECRKLPQTGPRSSCDHGTSVGTGRRRSSVVTGASVRAVRRAKGVRRRWVSSGGPRRGGRRGRRSRRGPRRRRGRPGGGSRRGPWRRRPPRWSRKGSRRRPPR